MKLWVRLAIFLAAWLLVPVAPCRAQAVAPTGAQAEPPRLIPTSEIEPGMTGYGLSVFRGTTIERFDVEVIGVLPQADLDGDWIMVRITSGPVAERGSGVIAGMSGSPVYFDDRLAGAVAYGYPFAKENVCFLTPIHDMLRVLDAADAELPPAGDQRTVSLPAPVTVDGRPRNKVIISDGDLDPAEVPADALVAEPLATPVMVAGLGAGPDSAVGRLLESYGLATVPGPGGGNLDAVTELEPGAAMGVGLVTGDVSVTAVGTVTYRDGDRILGFGHPMMQRNRVRLPLTGAYVVDFFNGLQRSFKISAPLAPVGTLDEDGHWAVAAKLGETPPMVPFEIRLRDADRDTTRVLRCEVVDDDVLTPQLLLAVTNDALGTLVGNLPKAMVATRLRVELAEEGFAPIERREVGLTAGAPQAVALSDLQATLQVLAGNPFQQLHPRRVTLDIDIARRDDTAVIQRMYIDRTVVKPGESVGVELELRRRSDGAVLQRKLEVRIPESLPAGKARLGVAGGDGRLALAQLLKLLQPPVQSPEQLLARFEETDTDPHELVAMVALPDVDLSLAGERLPNPPAAVAALLEQASITDLAKGQAVLEQSWPSDLVVTNGALAPITVTTPDGRTPDGQPQTLAVLPELAKPAPAEMVLRFSAPDRAAALLDTPLGAEPLAGGDEPADKDDAKPASGKAKELQSRAPQTFRHTTGKDFASGEGEQVSLASDGRLMLGLGGERLASSDEPVLWGAAVTDDGTVYAGSANDGLLLRLRPGADAPEVAWRGTGTPMVSAVAAAGGDVWFATVPDGRIRRLGPDGAASVVTETGAAYVWALLPLADGGVLAATGQPARLLRVADGRAEMLAQPATEHLLDLAAGPDGAIYIAGGRPGVLLRLADGRLQTLLTAGEPIAAVAATADGEVVYASGAELGAVGRDGRVRSLGKVDGERIHALAATPDGVLAAVAAKAAPARGSVWTVDPSNGERRRAFGVDALAVVDLVPAAGGVVAVTGAPGAVYRLRGPFAAEGSYLSPVLDAGGTATWGRAEVARTDDGGGAVEVSTRSGDSPRPGADWSGWQAIGEAIYSRPARYLQYRLVLRGDGTASPAVDGVRIDYALRNVAPELELTAPKPGAAWKGKATVEWKLKDANGDEPQVSLSARREGETEWRTLASELGGATGKHELDTKRLDDGVWRLRLSADDGLFNPDDPRSVEVLSPPVLIDNTVPKATLPPLRPADGRLDLTLVVSDNLKVAGCEWRIGDGPWYPAVAADGLFDGDLESVRLRTMELKPGAHPFRLRVRDAAGNETVVEQTVTVATPEDAVE